VNGLFYDPLTEKIHDWVGGEKDLRARIIRTIGKPEERFGEDHLRMLRAVRFAARLGFEIEAETFAAIQALAPKIKLISAERVREELVKLFAPPPGAPASSRRADDLLELKHAGKMPALPGAARGLVLLRDSGLLEHILPELAATIHCEQSPNYHPEGSVFNHIRLMLEKMQGWSSGFSLSGETPKRGLQLELLPWAVLLHDIAKPATASRDPGTGRIHFYGHEKIGAEMAEEILRRLKFSNQQIEAVVAAVKHHMQFKDVKLMRKATLRRMLLRETFPLELALHRLDSLGSHGDLEHYDYCVAAMEELKQQPEIHPPLLNGDDLIALGVPRGKRLGELLHELRDKQLAEELKTADEARAWVGKMLNQ
jgi:poly(A) polymerase